MKLEGRVALVTGAAKRVGRAIAVRLAKAGCHVAVHYNSSEEAAEKTVAACRQCGVRAVALQADLDDLAATAELVTDVLAEFGRLDVLVNNASVFERMNIDAFTPQDWERTLRINLTAPMVLAHAAREALTAARGRVINLCDAATARPWPEHLAYCVSKGGLETLTHVLARALAPAVNVVGVAPGVAAWPADYDEATRARLTARIPLQRAGTVDDIAAMVHFLLAEGDYITGTVISVDGGRSAV